MASTNSNKGRAVVLSAACVTMFFISSIALYSVVSKNLLRRLPRVVERPYLGFPGLSDHHGREGIFAGRISDKSAAQRRDRRCRCYGLGWFTSGTVTEPWQFYLWFSPRRRHRQRPGLQPRAHHRPKVVHRQERASPPASPWPLRPPALARCPRCSPRCSSRAWASLAPSRHSASSSL